MEIELHKKGMVQDARKLFFLLIFSITFGCSTLNNSQPENFNYEIVKYKSSDNSNFLNIKAFSFENKTQKIPAYFRVNNLVFNPTGEVPEFSMRIMEGNFQIEAGFIGKEEVKIKKLRAKRGDSIVLKIYLNDDPKSLH